MANYVTVRDTYDVSTKSLKEDVLDGNDYAQKCLEFWEEVEGYSLLNMSTKQKQWLERIEEQWPN